MDHGLGDIEALLEIADEPSPPDQPPKRPLDDPSARQRLETWLTVDAAHDFDDKIKERGLVEQLGAIVGAVGEQMLDPRPAFADRIQNYLCAGAVGDVRG